MEGRDVAVVDIPGAFMQADMDPNVFMRIDGLMAELLLEIDDAAYRPYLRYEKGCPIIYVELLKALYGTLRAARLFWEKLTGHIKEWGFELNPYDNCVANKIINGSQCTITWHVDDLKISHRDSSVVMDIINKLESTFGALGELSISRGKRHDYLGMYLNFSNPGQLIVDMRPYIATILSDAPAEMKGTARTPASAHLFEVSSDPNTEKLAVEQADLFHHLTMQLMYLAQRGRPDIRTAVAFLSTRVAHPDIHNWRKLGRVLKYLQSSVDLLLTLSCDNSGTLQWWVDASYATHSDMKGHTGAVFTMGEGAVSSILAKQKLVACSSTEAELIGVYDAMPQILWTHNFLMAQQYQIKDVIVYQDNQSAMLLKQNGQASSSRRTKHISIRYFFVKDCIDQEEMRIVYCPTEEMLANFHTKPLQGSLFLRLRDLLMNVAPSSPFHSTRMGPRSVLVQEGGEDSVTGARAQTAVPAPKVTPKVNENTANKGVAAKAHSN